ncbi:MAG: tyrosine-type recombinase/integrase [Steroidobacteraceae bacterium]
MASISRYRDGWRAHIQVKGVRESKLFRTRAEAADWAKQREQDLVGGSPETFASVAERWLAWKLPRLMNAKDQSTVEGSIRIHVLPVIGGNRLTDIRRPALVQLVRDLAATGKVETAQRVGQRIAAIFDFAVDEGAIESHPAVGLARVLPKKEKRNFAAIAPAELPTLLRAIDGYPEPVTRLGLLLLAHAFVRTSELIGARWTEIKGDAWVIPAQRMKRKIPHVVPITMQLRRLFDELEPMTGDSEFLLVSPFNSQASISENTLLFALYRLGYKGRMTGHGFRALASSILNESGLWSKDAIERQLAHKEVDAVRDAYLRAEFLPERRRMMDW